MSSSLLRPTFSTVKKLIATNTTRMRLCHVSLSCSDQSLRGVLDGNCTHEDLFETCELEEVAGIA
jgi:hypothetical protein